MAKTLEWEVEMAKKQEEEKNLNVKIEKGRYYERKESGQRLLQLWPN